MMQKSGKVVVVSQHYPPDPSTTAAIMAAISDRVAREAEVLVLSGTVNSAYANATRSASSRTGRRLRPACRAVAPDNPYRRPLSARFVAGLSGNLGFTHDPVIVFEAARLLRDNEDIHFLLSGWGIGFDQLRQMQAEARASERHAGRPRRRRTARKAPLGCRRLDHSVPQERRRRIGSEPVLQSAGDRPAGDPCFRTRRRSGADGDRA